MDDKTVADEIREITARVLDGSISDDELISRLRKLENRITPDELEALSGKDGGLRFDDGTVTAVRADDSVARVLRGPGDPPLIVG